MFVKVKYTGPKDTLQLHATTEPIVFARGEETEVPSALVPFLKEGLPGHGFTVIETPAPIVAAGAPDVEPGPEPAIPAKRTRGGKK